MLPWKGTAAPSQRDMECMVETETSVRTTARTGYRWQVVKALHGRYIRALWKSGLLILTLTGLLASYPLFKPGGSSPHVMSEKLLSVPQRIYKRHVRNSPSGGDLHQIRWSIPMIDPKFPH